MKFTVSAIFLSLIGRSVAANLTWTVSATDNGEPVPQSDIVMEPRPVLSHGLNKTTSITPPRPPTSNAKRNAISYSGNWCGAAAHSTSAHPITSVYAMFQAPVLSIRSSKSTPQYASAWVGIDGASCSSVLLQAGAYTTIDSTGSQSSLAWFEWVPNAASNLASFPVNPGDWLSVNVSASTTTTGKIVITNLNYNYVQTINLSNGPTLCRTDAEWILEDFSGPSGQVPFAAFEDLWYEGCTATRVGASDLNIDSADLIYLGSTSSNALCTSTEYDSGDFYMSSQN